MCAPETGPSIAPTNVERHVGVDRLSRGVARRHGAAAGSRRVRPGLVDADHRRWPGESTAGPGRRGWRRRRATVSALSLAASATAASAASGGRRRTLVARAAADPARARRAPGPRGAPTAAVSRRVRRWRMHGAGSTRARPGGARAARAAGTAGAPAASVRPPSAQRRPAARARVSSAGLSRRRRRPGRKSASRGHRGCAEPPASAGATFAQSCERTPGSRAASVITGPSPVRQREDRAPHAAQLDLRERALATHQPSMLLMRRILRSPPLFCREAPLELRQDQSIASTGVGSIAAQHGEVERDEVAEQHAARRRARRASGRGSDAERRRRALGADQPARQLDALARPAGAGRSRRGRPR